MSVQMSFDFERAEPVAAASLAPVPAAVDTRQARGSTGYHAGLSAESQVARDYRMRGYPLASQRWRGRSGEIDLVLRDGDGLVFVEVKKSRSHDSALARLTQRQVARLWAAAEEYLAGEPRGTLTDARFDVALVDGQGCIRVIENAFAG